MPHSGDPQQANSAIRMDSENGAQTSCICTHTAHPHPQHPLVYRSRIHPLTARYTMRSVLSRLSLSPCLPVHRPESPDNDSQQWEQATTACFGLLPSDREQGQP